MQREADEKETLPDGTMRVVYRGVTDADVDAFSEVLEQWGCTLLEYRTDGFVMTAVIGRAERSFTMVYDQERAVAELRYPAGTRCETW